MGARGLSCLLLGLAIADVCCGATARGLRLNGINGEAAEGDLQVRVRPVDSTPAHTLNDVLADYGDSSRGSHSAANWYSQLSKAFQGAGGEGLHGFGGMGMMTLPFLVVPVPVSTKASQECPVSQELGVKQVRTSAQSVRTLRPGAQPSAAESEESARAQRRIPDEVPYVNIVESSERLVQLFREQQPYDPDLPPALIPDYGDAQAVAGYEAAQRLLADAPPYHYQGPTPEAPQPQQVRQVLRMQRRRAPLAAPAPPAPAAAEVASYSLPPRPRFAHSVVMRGKLTVPRADYTEPYTVWWDAESGAARVDFHGGATSTYRVFKANGLMQAIELKVDRTGETDAIRCAATTPRPAQPSDRALPALPDLDLFNFEGYLNSEAGRVERWTHTLVGGPGEKGAARGEALTFKHELLLARALDNETVLPLRYTVRVDSSVLGPDCDGYTHVYSEYRETALDPSILSVDIDGACDSVTPTEQVDRVAPLKEFTLPHRDPRYDDILLQFIVKNARQYSDDTEWAVRKNLLVQSSRFVSSGNRQGATFETDLNFLGDRLQEELRSLSGVDFSEVSQFIAEEEEGPARRGRQAVAGRRLPARFDWRDIGGVTHVRFQGMTCMSCWAFAVAGAVEGVLFAKTGALVPLSEQCLVDCAQPYGANGCNGTWPAAAYNYIQDRGLRALNEYVPYKEKVLQCVDTQVEPVTHIRGHVNVTKFNVRALKKAILENSPTVVVIDANTCKSFQFYKQGVIQDDRCKKRRGLNHAVLAVGYDEHRREPHFVVKNSWSAKWGDGGYARLHGPSNAAGVLTWPSYPLLERPDVDRRLAAA